MRYETQQRDKVFAQVEIVLGGTPVTGLSPTYVIKRVSDGLFWDGAAWGAPAVSLSLAEVDATDQAGYYKASLPASAVDITLGASGYEYQATAVVSPSITVTENVFVNVVEEVTIEAIGGAEGDPVAVRPVDDLVVQSGTTASVTLGVATTPLVNGKAGAFALTAALIDVGGTVTDLIAAGLTTPDMIELATAPSVAVEAAVTGVPVFSSGGGPASEDVYTVAVDDSSSFAVGNYVRGKGKGSGAGHVHQVLEIPDGTSIVLWSTSADFDIVNGDTLERVLPSGIYVGSFGLAVDTYLSSANPIGQLKVSMRSIGVAAGAGPKFAAETSVVWVRNVELDTAGRRFNTG